MISRKTGLVVLAVVTLLIVVADVWLPRIPQPLSYHQFADQREWLGIANFGDVVSNVPFAVVGIWGLVFLLRLRGEALARCFVDRRERWPYLLIFAGLVLTAWGSSYYHLRPDNARLVWDRLPMTIVFMSLVAALIAERINLLVGLWLAGAAGGRRGQRGAVVLERDAWRGRSAILRVGAGLLGSISACDADVSGAVYARVGPAGRGGVLCAGEGAGDV